MHPSCLELRHLQGPGNNSTVEQRLMRLRDVMQMLGHDHITLLKMGIEGYEDDVLDELVDDNDVRGDGRGGRAAAASCRSKSNVERYWSTLGGWVEWLVGGWVESGLISVLWEGMKPEINLASWSMSVPCRVRPIESAHI